MKDLVVVDVAQLSPTSAPFCDLAELDGAAVRWIRHSGLPQSWLEQKISRPKLSRYRAAIAAARHSARASAVISHMPWTSAMTALLMEQRGTRRPHLAFSFNFTRPPQGAALRYFRRALAPVARFAVFTEYEAGLYSELLQLPGERFRPVLWTQEAPVPGPVGSDLLPDRPFVVALGGEGRDFAVLKAAARALPDMAFVVVARPTPSLADAPPNMTVLFNQPWATCWGLAANSLGLLVPLVSERACCGHITLVSGRMAGIPMVTTASVGTTEYSAGFDATQTVAAGDVDGWIAAIKALAERKDALAAAARGEAIAARQRHDRSLWSAYTAEFLRTFS